MTAQSSAVDYWFSIVHLGHSSPEFIENMFDSLSNERPPILSVVGERSCAQQCAHCIFQPERSSQSISLASSLTTAVRVIVQQMGPNPIVIHEGRMFRPWHLSWLMAVRQVRPDARVGMIDTEAFLEHADAIRKSGFEFDWLDISIDGPRDIHIRQRHDNFSFERAINGIRNAEKFLSPSGRVTSLFTLTKINYSSVLATCKILPVEVSEWHITTISPVRPEIQHLSVDDDEFKEAWSQIVSANKIRPVYFRIYVAEDMLKLARAVGKEKFLAAMERAEASNCAISLTIDDVSVFYYPQSVAPAETFVLDADAYYRVPYSLAYTLDELRIGVSRFGRDIRAYSIGKVGVNSQFDVLYMGDVLRWRGSFGLTALNKEIAVFNAIRQL